MKANPFQGHRASMEKKTLEKLLDDAVVTEDGMKAVNESWLSFDDP